MNMYAFVKHVGVFCFALYHNLDFIQVTHLYIDYMIIITAMSHERHDASNRMQLNDLFNRLVRLASKKTSKLSITGFLWGQFTSDRWISLRWADNAGSISISWRHHDPERMVCLLRNSENFA